IKAMNPEVETIFIKPPAKRNAEKVVTYADISCNSSISTVQAMSQAAVSLGKQHRIIIMMETGELRGGVMAPDRAAFYAQASSLPSIEVVGLGASLAGRM